MIPQFSIRDSENPRALPRDVVSLVDGDMARFREARFQAARARGGFAQIREAFDRGLRTDAIEYLDRPDYPETKKLRIVRAVHGMNVATGSYRRFLSQMEPTLREVATRTGRPARLLELASGAGGFAHAVSAIAAKRGIPVVVEGSDVVPIYVDTANRVAAERGLPVSFRHLDALAMSDVADQAFDVVFIAQSMHHFSPGQLGQMIAETSRIATTAFFGFDGYRSLFMLGFVGLGSLLSFQPDLIHDSWVTARKFYAHDELARIAEVSVPTATVDVRRLYPLNTMLNVRFQGAPRGEMAS